MSTLALRLPNELLSSLDQVAKFFDRSKNYVAVKAIKRYIDETLEEIQDMEDAEVCLQRMNDPDMETISLEEGLRLAAAIRNV